MAKRRPVEVAPHNPKGRELVMLTNLDVPTFYANNAQIDISNFDIKIRLGEIASVTPEKVNVKNVANVFMSHSHFKAFVNACNGLVAQMEQLPDPSKAYTVNPIAKQLLDE